MNDTLRKQENGYLLFTHKNLSSFNLTLRVFTYFNEGATCFLKIIHVYKML